MPDPHVTAGIALGAAVSPVAILLGAHVDALVIGMMAAVFISFWLQSVDSKTKAVSAVLFASMMAGYGSPLAVAYVTTHAPELASDADALRLFLAFALGAVSPLDVQRMTHE